MALLLAFGFAAVRRVETLPLVFGAALVVAFAARRPRQVLRGLRGPLALAAGFLLALPLMSGQTEMWRLGPLRVRAEGLEAGLLVAGRLLAIATATLALLATLPAHRLAIALRGLGAPAVVADLALLTLRYVDELREEAARAHLARRLRGGGARWRDLSDHGAMLAAALIRGHRRAEAVWAAMRLRGHGAALVAPQPAPTARDAAGVALAALVAMAAVAADRLA